MPTGRSCTPTSSAGPTGRRCSWWPEAPPPTRSTSGTWPAVEALGAGPDLTDDDTFTAWRLRTAPLGYARWDATTQAHARGMRYYLAAARAFMAGETPADLRERLRAVTAPTLVVAGAQDASAGVAPVLAVAGLFPRGESAVVEGSGHVPWVERPAAFRAVVDPFLARTVHPPA